MPGHDRVGSVTFGQVQVDLEVDTAQRDHLAAFGIDVELALACSFVGDVIASGILHAVLGSTGEVDGVRLACSKLVAIGSGRGQQAAGQQHLAIIRRRRYQVRLGAAVVGGLVENAVAGVVGSQAQGIGHLQAQLGLVTLVAIGAVGIAHIRRRRRFGAAEHVVAIGIARVQQAKHVGFDFLDLTGNRGAVGIAQATVTGLDRQFTGALQRVVDGREHALFLQQRVLDRGHVAAVLVQQRALLLQHQQARSTDRVVPSALDARLRSDLLGGFGQVRVVFGVAVGAGLIKLSS
ncbi:hypothetical protein D3C76_819830 [compost metagenome]